MRDFDLQLNMFHYQLRNNVYETYRVRESSHIIF